jgi:hypothetical protein
LDQLHDYTMNPGGTPYFAHCRFVKSAEMAVRTVVLSAAKGASN